MQRRVFIKLNQLIYDYRKDSKRANHFYNLRNRLLFGKKLTKKMKENLEWISK